MTQSREGSGHRGRFSSVAIGMYLLVTAFSAVACASSGGEAGRLVHSGPSGLTKSGPVQPGSAETGSTARSGILQPGAQQPAVGQGDSLDQLSTGEEPAGAASQVATGLMIAGTDSERGQAVTAVPSPKLEARLQEFGRRYLAYDYRVDQGAQVEGLRALVTPELFALFSQAMPPALVESLAAEQRVVEVEPVAVVGVAANVYQLSSTVRTTATNTAPKEETRTLFVTVNDANLVSDVR